MKNFFKTFLLAAAVAVVASGCSSDDSIPPPHVPDPGPLAAPSFERVNGDINAGPQEITDKMSIIIKALAPAGLKTFTVNIDSPALSDEVLGTMGLAKNMDLINPATDAMGKALNDMGFPTGADVKDKTEVTFDISTLVPLIKTIFNKPSTHTFKIMISDNQDRKKEKSLQFTIKGKSTVVIDKIDLWNNSVSFTATIESNRIANIDIKNKNDKEWEFIGLTGQLTTGIFKGTYSPSWQEEVSPNFGALYRLDNKTGVYPGNTYEYRLVEGSDVYETHEFTIDPGPAIEYGNMNTWSKYVGYGSGSVEVDYPNPDQANAFWSNGNNSIVKELCTPLALADDNKYAHLKGKETYTVFAAGNLFTGVFEMSGLSGYARFGQKYTFTARPSALKLRYKAKVSNITHVNPDANMALPDHMKVGQPDPARIFVCITNWTERHSVHSGLGVKMDEINGFDPEKDNQTAEGKVLAYGSLTINQNVNDWTEVTIPILYKDKVSKPTNGNYSLVISCASSAYGDYLCGSIDNELDVDDFEWVY